jgi:hypothetical protein
MIVVCNNCQEEIADVTVLHVFNAAVSCGKCGQTFGQRFAPDPALEPAAPVKPTSAETKNGHYFVDGREVARPEFDAAIAQL